MRRKHVVQSIEFLRVICIIILICASCALMVSKANAAPPDSALREDWDQLPGQRILLPPPVDGGIYVPPKLKISYAPQYNRPFDTSCYVYLNENGLYGLRFIIHTTDEDGKAFACRVGKFYALLWRVANNHFGTICANLRRSPVNVWLTNSGSPGGEQFRNNIYIYDYPATRAPMEWNRELAHEYGHYLLPSASGYTDPESWANGILGERLFNMWIGEDAEKGIIPLDGYSFASASDIKEYCNLQIAPLLNSMREIGPDINLLKRLDHVGMDAFTGLILYADQTWGSDTIFQMLDYLPQTPTGAHSGMDFLQALTSYLSSLDRFTINLPKSKGWVYLPAGKFFVTAPADQSIRISPSRGCRIQNSVGGAVVSIASSKWRDLSGPEKQKWVKEASLQ